MPEMPRTQTWHLPVADVETQPYWDAAADGTLLIKSCNSCGKPFFYPREHCPRCWSTDTAWTKSKGKGRVYTFTIVRQNDLPPFRDRVPYVVAIVELKEGVRMTANIEGCRPEDVRCDMKVKVAFREEPRGDGSVFLPVFRPA
ncbi:MAG TPA: Zn-ribbon domain-containing OB-fold protein [Actinomycetota bacterium]